MNDEFWLKRWIGRECPMLELDSLEEITHLLMASGDYSKHNLQRIVKDVLDRKYSYVSTNNQNR